jgi:hypothetical protein
MYRVPAVCSDPTEIAAAQHVLQEGTDKPCKAVGVDWLAGCSTWNCWLAGFCLELLCSCWMPSTSGMAEVLLLLLLL